MRVTKKVAKKLKTEGFSDQQIDKVKRILAENIPPRVYMIAVCFIGLITLALIIGAFAVIRCPEVNMEPIWVAIGAGLGALAGIFSSNK